MGVAGRAQGECRWARSRVWKQRKAAQAVEGKLDDTRLIVSATTILRSGEESMNRSFPAPSLTKTGLLVSLGSVGRGLGMPGIPSSGDNTQRLSTSILPNEAAVAL